MFCLIVSIFVVIATGTTHDYHVTIVGFLATGLVLTSSSVNDLMYTSDHAKEAAAAGFILISIANVGNTFAVTWMTKLITKQIVWIFLFATRPWQQVLSPGS